MTGFIISIIIGTIVNGVLVWGLIELFDRGNKLNTFPTAFFLGFFLSLPTISLLVLIVLGYMLLQYYGLTFPQLIFFIILFIAVWWLIGLGLGLVKTMF